MIVKNRKGVAARLAASVLSWSCTPNERRLMLLKVACKVVDTNARICSIVRHSFPDIRFHLAHFVFDVYQVVVYNAGIVPLEIRQIIIQQCGKPQFFLAGPNGI